MEKEKFKIRHYQKDDYKEVCLLIARTFKEFNSSDGTREGVRDYVSFYRHYKKNRDEIEKTFKMTKIFLVVKDEDDDIIGMIRGKKNRISNLFIDRRYHGKGLGKELVKRFESIARKMGSKEINIRSSLHGENFYKRMGYHAVAPITTMKGTYVRPMIKRFW